MCVNNLTKVVTWQRNGRELNLRPLKSQANALAITPPPSRQFEFWWGGTRSLNCILLLLVLAFGSPGHSRYTRYCFVLVRGWTDNKDNSTFHDVHQWMCTMLDDAYHHTLHHMPYLYYTCKCIRKFCLFFFVRRINNDWSFDEAMAEYGCEVHSFDPRSVVEQYTSFVMLCVGSILVVNYGRPME